MTGYGRNDKLRWGELKGRYLRSATLVLLLAALCLLSGPDSDLGIIGSGGDKAKSEG